MNKHELKSLLENIYEAMILPGLADPYLKNPSLLNPTPPTPPKPPVLTPGGLDDPYTIDDLLRFLRGLSRTFKGTSSVAEQADTVNKHELKSLLENIYHLLAEDDWWRNPQPGDAPLPPNGPPPTPPSTPNPSTTPYVLPNPWWQPKPPPPTPPKPVYPPWPTDPEDERSRMRGLMIDDYDGWLNDMERDPQWWRDRYGFDVLEWWRSQNPGTGYTPSGASG